MANRKKQKKAKWWRKRARRRRNYRSAPEERPTIPVPEGLRDRFLKICGEELVEVALGAFPEGNLPGTPEEFQALEEVLLEKVRTHCVAQLLAAVVHEAHCHDDFVNWCMAAAARRQELRSNGEPSVEVRLAGGGKVRLNTPYMTPPPPKSKPGPKVKPGQRGEGGAGLYPVLGSLGVVARTSPSVASAAARAAAREGSFEEGSAALAEQGIDLHRDTVRTLSAHVADAGLADREQATPIDPEFFANKRVVISPDGGRIRCRHERPGRRRKSGFHGFDAIWREPKLFTAYVIDKEGNQERKELPVYEGTLAPWKDAIEIWAKTLLRYGIQKAAVLVIAADGSDNIWREVDRLIELLKIDRSKVVAVVDFYHAVEHLSDAAKLSNSLETDLQRRQWVNKQRRRLKRGQVERILFDMAALPTDDENAAEKLRTECDYFRSRKDKMRYNEFSRQGLPIGTGAIESTVRRVVNLRLKGPCYTWNPENIERMLYLRTRLKAGRWHEVESALHRAALVPKRSIKPSILAKVVQDAKIAKAKADKAAKAKADKAAKAKADTAAKAQRATKAKAERAA